MRRPFKSKVSIVTRGTILGLIILPLWSGSGQSMRSLIDGGNDLYDQHKFSDAEVQYRKALEKESGAVQGHFNLGNSLYKQKKYDESVKEFDDAVAHAKHDETKAFAWYNRGNSFLSEQKYEDAVRSYVESLKLQPDDYDAKYNLSYALEKMKQSQQQQKQQNKNQDKKNDKKKDQNKQDQDKQNQDKQNQDKQDQKNDEQQNQQKQQEGSQQEKQMSRADANRILDVLKNNEKEVQRKLRVRKGARTKTDKDW
jgi:Ca-activated chloride channel homolog